MRSDTAGSIYTVHNSPRCCTVAAFHCTSLPLHSLSHTACSVSQLSNPCTAYGSGRHLTAPGPVHRLSHSGGAAVHGRAEGRRGNWRAGGDLHGRAGRVGGDKCHTRGWMSAVATHTSCTAPHQITRLTPGSRRPGRLGCSQLSWLGLPAIRSSRPLQARWRSAAKHRTSSCSSTMMAFAVRSDGRAI